MKRSIKIIISIISLFLFHSCDENKLTQEESNEIEWNSFTPTVFEIGKKENKLILLEVGANWCHWCHVMDDSTYSNGEVQKYLNENFILAREDQDSRPDLYASYRAYGWPAIILFNPEGDELLKLKGYQPRKKFLSDLKAVVQNPVPLKSMKYETKKVLPVAVEKISNQFNKRLDYKIGGYAWTHKFIKLEGIEHGLQYYQTNDSLKKWVDLTIKNSYKLVDPVWSGVYQYSAKRNWENQHYEKLLRVQAAYIESYASYAGMTKNQEALKKAIEIYEYCERFLGNETPLFWNSQNADLIAGVHSGNYYALNEKERLAQGTPSVDKHTYLKENAAMIKALLHLWAASNDPIYLKKATAMTTFILAEFKNGNGLFVRENGNNKILSFEDNRQFLHVLMLFYELTGKEDYLDESNLLANAIIENFKLKDGIPSAIGELAIPATTVPFDNLNAVLTFNQLGHLTKNKVYIDYAKTVFSLLNAYNLSKSENTLPLLIRAKKELNEEPYHAVYITNGKDKTLGTKMYQTTLISQNPYLIFEWLTIGKMDENQERLYGEMEDGTLFICTSTFCSSPFYNEKDLANFLKCL